MRRVLILLQSLPFLCEVKSLRSPFDEAELRFSDIYCLKANVLGKTGLVMIDEGVLFNLVSEDFVERV